MTTLTPLLLLGLAPGWQDAPAAPEPEAVELASTITEVTVYGSGAAVRREAQVPAGGGMFVLRGLPFALDPDSVRVRSQGGEVVSVEFRERFQKNVPDERVAALRDGVVALERELAVLQDDAELLDLLQQHFVRLLLLEEEGNQRELREGRISVEALEENYRYLRGKLVELRGERREQGLAIEAKRLELNDARLELGRFEGSGGVRLRDALVDVVDTTGGAVGSIELEYVVGNAGWRPHYDLRAKKDLSAVELAYRAKVWQRSGEDWRGAQIVLSTAQPQRGAQGPDARPVWLSLNDPRAGRAAQRARSLEVSGSDAFALNAPPESPAAAPPFAQVSSEGLSAHFRLARTETIESRDQPTTVLIGRADLAIQPEHSCVPALDTTVWLRARTTNSSDWVMLPGRASVYFGSDFVGHANLGAVQLEQEFTVHLGPDPGLVVERVQLEDLTEESGMFSSKASLVESWRIRIENHGAFSSRRDGSVAVIVQEALPRSRDDRIEVEIDEIRPRLREDERWKKEREEKGILTWIVNVPRGAEQTIELRTVIAYPEKMQVQRQ